MRASEKCLLIAVRDRLRSQLNLNLDTEYCEVEHDEMAATIAGQRGFVVMSGGWVPGPHHRKSGGVNDLVYGVSVLCIRRMTHVPRDRRREVFIGHLGDLTAETDSVFGQVDFRYEVLNAANSLIESETGSTQGFEEPLVFTGIDSKPRFAPAEIFGGKNEPAAGLMRAIHFHGARRITHK